MLVIEATRAKRNMLLRRYTRYLALLAGSSENKVARQAAATNRESTR
jgi:hypothetical protein